MTTTFTDRWGVPVQGGDGAAVALLDQAIEDLVGLGGDPVGGTDRAIAADPALALARIYRAYLSLYGTSAEGVAQAIELLTTVAPETADPREAHHLAAARAWADGDWHAATRHLDRALLANPRDLLALKVAQDLHFLVGNRAELRDVAARVLPAWPRGDPAWGFVQGIYAFGLEENGDYRGAERAARNALECNPGDVWGVHALAHVFEMEGSHEAGVSFLTGSSPNWERSYFAVHNWWHLGLYLLELGRLNDAVALYDQRVRAQPPTGWLDIIDAAALLWRLALYGQDVATRAQALAADISDQVGPPVYLFNDWHALMTFALAGDHARSATILAANQDAGGRTNSRAARRAGLDLLSAFSAFATGRPQLTAGLLTEARHEASVVGGSHAQRDIIDLTLIAAAARGGEAALVRALVAERVARKPPAAASALALVLANGGYETWLAWLGRPDLAWKRPSWKNVAGCTLGS
ncbi:MAG TPA: tetratricopeptide repeat protein [Trebonia sp.]|nr:tetratricopeptide repeat protein [Trebonia sp.]